MQANMNIGTAEGPLRMKIEYELRILEKHSFQDIGSQDFAPKSSAEPQAETFGVEGSYSRTTWSSRIAKVDRYPGLLSRGNATTVNVA